MCLARWNQKETDMHRPMVKRPRQIRENRECADYSALDFSSVNSLKNTLDHYSLYHLIPTSWTVRQAWCIHLPGWLRSCIFDRQSCLSQFLGVFIADSFSSIKHQARALIRGNKCCCRALSRLFFGFQSDGPGFFRLSRWAPKWQDMLTIDLWSLP